MGNIGMQELLIVLLILVLVFGASRLPQLGRGIGEAIRNLKKGLQSGDEADAAGKGEAPKS